MLLFCALYLLFLTSFYFQTVHTLHYVQLFFILSASCCMSMFISAFEVMLLHLNDEGNVMLYFDANIM